MAMYLGIFRVKKIGFFYWFFVFVGYFRAPALFILPFYIGNELISLWTQPEANVAFMAHVSGFITRALLIELVVWRKPESLNHEYIEQDQAAMTQQISTDLIYQKMDKFQFSSALQQLDKHIKEFGADFSLKILKYKLLYTVKPAQAHEFFNQIIKGTRPNNQQLAQISSIWQGLPKEERTLEPDAQYKLAWNFIAVPEYIEHAVHLFERMYQAENKHPSLSVLAKKISVVFKQLDNRAENEKFIKIARELG